MTSGTVKFYNDQKGFGFIAPDDGGNDVFVHATALERAGIRHLGEGQKVEFETQRDQRTGKMAVTPKACRTSLQPLDRSTCQAAPAWRRSSSGPARYDFDPEYGRPSRRPRSDNRL
jgi:cold shock protein